MVFPTIVSKVNQPEDRRSAISDLGQFWQFELATDSLDRALVEGLRIPMRGYEKF